MKRLIYITYLGLLALILIACQKETVAPLGAAPDIPADETRASYCRNYSFLTKQGVFQLGNLRTENILVGFADNVTAAHQQSLLSQYNIFDQIDSYYYADSGIIAIISLKSNATCQRVESMIRSLESKRQVTFAGPTFNDPNGVLAWIAPGNEIMVTLKDAAYYPQLRQLARITRTTIVDNLWDATYLLSVDKHSAGTTLQMCSVFNVAPYVDIAEPNFLMMAPPMEKGGKPIIRMSKEVAGQQMAF